MALVSDTIFSLLILASGVLAASTLGFAAAWVRARERAIRAERRGAPTTDGDDRFDRLERAVEAIAGEVDRMSEGQRFVGELLAGRAGESREAGTRPEHVLAPR
jgi:hypothetical protein